MPSNQPSIKMKRVLILLLTAIFAFSFVQCSDDDDNVPSCKLLKWNPRKFRGDTIYQNEHLYENNRLTTIISPVTFINVDNSLNIPSTYTINYRADGRPLSIDSESRYDEFQYNGNSSRPSVRNHYRKLNGIKNFEFTEQIIYDSKGRIIKTIQENDNELTQYHSTLTTTYEYVNNNLYRYAELYYTITPNYTRSYGFVTYFDGYDDKKNPFENFKSPFVGERQLQYSKNNWISLHKAVIDDEGNEKKTGSYHERGFAYNEFGYPLPGIYDCD